MLADPHEKGLTAGARPHVVEAVGRLHRLPSSSVTEPDRVRRSQRRSPARLLGITGEQTEGHTGLVVSGAAQGRTNSTGSAPAGSDA